MNKEYTYIDGKVIIVDENNNKKKEDYYDNLNDVLIQENVIETMENKYQELIKLNPHEQYMPNALITYIFMTIVGIPSLCCTTKMDDKIKEILNQINLPMKLEPAILLGLFTTGVGLSYLLCDKSINYMQGKKNDGIASQIEFLQDQIPVEKEALEKLKSIRTKEKENTNFRTVTIDDSERLNVLKSYLDLYFELGYHGNKYYRYYQQNKLDRKLQKTFTEEGIQLAKEYLEEKGPIYSKKRVSKKN